MACVSASAVLVSLARKVLRAFIPMDPLGVNHKEELGWEVLDGKRAVSSLPLPKKSLRTTCSKNQGINGLPFPQFAQRGLLIWPCLWRSSRHWSAWSELVCLDVGGLGVWMTPEG